jgi:hypothetical protein
MFKIMRGRFIGHQQVALRLLLYHSLYISSSILGKKRCEIRLFALPQTAKRPFLKKTPPKLALSP